MGFILIPGSLEIQEKKLLDIKPIPLPFQFIPFHPLCLLWDLEDCLALLKNLFQQFFNHTSFNRTESFQISWHRQGPRYATMPHSQD